LSVLTIGEIRRGVERIRRRDAKSARALEAWLRRLVAEHSDRILPIDEAVAEEWGRLGVPDPIPVIDGLLAATARVHGLTFATRNQKDVMRTGVPYVNPFAPTGPR
jgi:toxin FitB